MYSKYEFDLMNACCRQYAVLGSSSLLCGLRLGPGAGCRSASVSSYRHHILYVAVLKMEFLATVLCTGTTLQIYILSCHPYL